jgi:CheY-like chemotaxis protein
VLVVDDKQYNRLVLLDMLAPLGFEVVTANDGQQADTMKTS